MNKERFQALAAAYGGAVSRWPNAERRAARWFALWRHGLARTILRDAGRLDRLLLQSARPEVGLGLHRSLIEGAYYLHRAGKENRPWLGAILGAGLAGACAAGIGVGFMVAPLTTPDLLTIQMDPAEVAASALGNPTELGDG